MKMSIVVVEPLEKKILEVDDEGIAYLESAAFGIGEKSRHGFGEIDAVVRSAGSTAAPVLSIQVGHALYRIRYKPADANHLAVIDFIVAQARKSMQTR